MLVRHEALGADEAELMRHRDLVAEWDRISLGLCLDWDLELDPWRFAADELTVACEGRRLESRFDDEEELRDALRSAPLVPVRFTLRPGAGPGRS